MNRLRRISTGDFAPISNFTCRYNIPLTTTRLERDLFISSIKKKHFLQFSSMETLYLWVKGVNQFECTTGMPIPGTMKSK